MFRTFAMALRFNTFQVLLGVLGVIFGVTGALTVMPPDPALPFAAPDYKTIFTVIAVIGLVMILAAMRSANKHRSDIINTLG